MALFRGNSSGSGKSEKTQPNEPHKSEVDPVNQGTYKNSGSDSRHPMTDGQVLDMVEGTDR